MTGDGVKKARRVPRPARFAPTKNRAYRFTRVKVADFVIPPAEAVIVTTVLLFTEAVLIVNFADVLPANTLTVAGTLAFVGLLLETLIVISPAGAGAVSVIVPTDVRPPRTLLGLSDIPNSPACAAGFTVNDVDFVTPL
jgi:hypothetical protein